MNSTPVRNLFTRLKLGALQLGHRIVLIGQPGLAGTGRPGEALRSLADHYRTHTLEASLVICTIAPVQDCANGPVPGIRSAHEVNGWRTVVEAIHASGAIAVARIGDARAVGEQLPNTDQVDDALNAYRAAADNASDAGFDGVELVGTHGSLPERLLSVSRDLTGNAGWPSDDLSGANFLTGALQTLFGTWPPDRVGLSLSLPQGAGLLGLVSRALLSLDGIELAYIHLTAGNRQPRPLVQSVAMQVRPIFRSGLIVSGSWTSQDAEAAIAAGELDAVGADEKLLKQIDASGGWRQADGVIR